MSDAELIRATEAKLKACQFCGYPGRLVIAERMEELYYSVGCARPGCIGVPDRAHKGNFLAQLVNDWDTRTEPR